MVLTIIGINMGNKVKKLIIIILFSTLFLGCTSQINEKVDYPFQTLEIVPSKNKTMSIVIIKTGIEGGATVPFGYEFYFSKDDKTLSRNKLFLMVRGLETYRIKWLTSTTISVDIKASRIIKFNSEVIVDNKVSHFYDVGNFTFTLSEE